MKNMEEQDYAIRNAAWLKPAVFTSFFVLLMLMLTLPGFEAASSTHGLLRIGIVLGGITTTLRAVRVETFSADIARVIFPVIAFSVFLL